MDVDEIMYCKICSEPAKSVIFLYGKMCMKPSIMVGVFNDKIILSEIKGT